MNLKKKITIIVVIILIIIIAAIAVIWRIKQSSAEASVRPALITNIVVGKAIRGDIEHIETLTGNVMSDQQASIYSKVNGNIEQIYVDIGDFVKQNQLLALIDTTIYAQNVKQASASYDQTLANVANAKVSYERNKSLLQQNLIAKQDVDNSKTAYDVALSQKDGAYANYTNAVTQLSYCKIKATFTGYVTKRYFDPGVYVTSNTNASSSILFTLTDLDKLKADVNLPEKDIQLLNNIIGIEVVADAIPGQIFKAKLRKISGAVDLATRTMEVEIDIINADNLLKPGMFVKIFLILEKKSNVLILPDFVIQNDQTGDFVFIVNSNNTVTKRLIKKGILQDNKYEILSGITENDPLVFSGQNVLNDGSAIKITK